MRRFDVAVIGAGPAGAVTAHALATRGASVVLLDRARFPRDKPCGGGVTMRAARLLPVRIDPVVEDRIHAMDFRLGYKTAFSRTSDEPIVFMTQRERLDAFLADRAAGAGAELREGVKASAIEPDGSGVVVRTDAGTVHATLAIGADGVNGVRAASVGSAGSHTASPSKATFRTGEPHTNATPGGSWSSWASCPADTPGSSRRRIT